MDIFPKKKGEDKGKGEPPKEKKGFLFFGRKKEANPYVRGGTEEKKGFSFMPSKSATPSDKPLSAQVLEVASDPQKGAVLHVQVSEGVMRKGQRVRLSSGHEGAIVELGRLAPQRMPAETLMPGETGYVLCGLKDPAKVFVGDMIVDAERSRVGAAVPVGGSTAAAVPVWTGGGKAGSSLKVRGGAFVPASLTERFRRLRGRDLAFILAGLAVLIMAPLAEYLMTNPESGSGGALQPGFDQRGSMFPEGGSPYEDGLNSVAPGSLLGQDSDVITPLNVRDPSSLIIGPNSQQQQPAATAKVETTSTSRKTVKEDWREAIKSSASAGGQAAVKKAAGLPRPPGKLAGALRGLGALTGGGGGPSFKLEAPSSKGLVSNKGGGPGGRGGPGFRGGGRQLFAGQGGGGNRFGPGGAGGAGSNLDVLTGGAGGGQGTSEGRGSAGDQTTNPSGSSNKDSKSGNPKEIENLALLRAKLELEKAIALKWDKKRYDQLERKKMFEQIATQTAFQTAQQALLKILDKLLEGKKSDKPSGGGGSSGGARPSAGSTAGRPGTERRDPPRIDAPRPEGDFLKGVLKAGAIPAREEALLAIEGLTERIAAFSDLLTQANARMSGGGGTPPWFPGGTDAGGSFDFPTEQIRREFNVILTKGRDLLPRFSAIRDALRTPVERTLRESNTALAAKNRQMRDQLRANRSFWNEVHTAATPIKTPQNKDAPAADLVFAPELVEGGSGGWSGVPGGSLACNECGGYRERNTHYDAATQVVTFAGGKESEALAMWETTFQARVYEGMIQPLREGDAEENPIKAIRRSASTIARLVGVADTRLTPGRPTTGPISPGIPTTGRITPATPTTGTIPAEANADSITATDRVSDAARKLANAADKIIGGANRTYPKGAAEHALDLSKHAAKETEKAAKQGTKALGVLGKQVIEKFDRCLIRSARGSAPLTSATGPDGADIPNAIPTGCNTDPFTGIIKANGSVYDEYCYWNATFAAAQRTSQTRPGVPCRYQSDAAHVYNTQAHRDARAADATIPADERVVDPSWPSYNPTGDITTQKIRIADKLAPHQGAIRAAADQMKTAVTNLKLEAESAAAFNDGPLGFATRLLQGTEAP